MNQEIPRRFPAAAQDRIVYLNQQLLDPQIHYIVAFEARLDESRLKRCVRLAMDAEPVFGCRYVPGRPPHWKRRDDRVCERSEDLD